MWGAVRGRWGGGGGGNGEKRSCGVWVDWILASS